MMPFEARTLAIDGIIVIGRDSVYRSGLCSILRDHNVQVRFCEAEVLINHAGYIILIEPSLPLLRGFAEKNPTSFIIVVYQNDVDFTDLHNAGADAGCSIDCSSDAIVFFLQTLLGNENIFIWPKNRTKAPPHNSHIEAKFLFPETDLTAAELAVVGELTKGSPNKVIAYRLRLSEATIKSHMRSIFRKLGARTRAEAALTWAHLHPVEMTSPKDNLTQRNFSLL